MEHLPGDRIFRWLALLVCQSLYPGAVYWSSSRGHDVSDMKVDTPDTKLFTGTKNATADDKASADCFLVSDKFAKSWTKHNIVLRQVQWHSANPEVEHD